MEKKTPLSHMWTNLLREMRVKYHWGATLRTRRNGARVQLVLENHGGL